MFHHDVDLLTLAMSVVQYQAKELRFEPLRNGQDIAPARKGQPNMGMKPRNSSIAMERSTRRCVPERFRYVEVKAVSQGFSSGLLAVRDCTASPAT